MYIWCMYDIHYIHVVRMAGELKALIQLQWSLKHAVTRVVPCQTPRSHRICPQWIQWLSRSDPQPGELGSWGVVPRKDGRLTLWRSQAWPQLHTSPPNPPKTHADWSTEETADPPIQLFDAFPQYLSGIVLWILNQEHIHQLTNNR